MFRGINWLSIMCVIFLIGAMICAIFTQDLAVIAQTVGLAAIAIALLVIADTRSQ